MVFISSVPQENNKSRVDLDELIDGIEDVTDPSSMDKVLSYLEEIERLDDNFIELLTLSVGDAKIYWEIPWYQERGSLIRQGPMPVENDGTGTFRTDTMSQAEHEQIEKNWCKFKKKYDLPNQIISLARWKNRNGSRNPANCAEERARRFAAAFLARGLERTIAQVFKHVIKFYGGYRTGFFNKTEEKIIDICFHHQPKLMANILCSILGRKSRGVYKRLDQLTNGKPDKKRLKWTLPLASKLVQCMLRHTELELDDLKNRQIEMWVWRKLEDDMDQETCHLQHFWYCYLHVQIFVSCDVKLFKLRKRLFKKLRSRVRDSSYKIWSDIRWKDIVKYFPDGFTPRFIYRVCTVFVKSLKGYLLMPLEDVINYALDKMKNQKGKIRNKRLKTLKMNSDGQLEAVHYES